MEHYYTNDPTSRSEIREISYELEGRRFTFETDHGVFSMERVDHGSDILIRALRRNEPSVSGQVIDLGCGYGAIGVTLAVLYPEAQFHLIDVNDRAMALARRNAEKIGVSDRIEVGTAQISGEAEAELVVTNPPIRAGKETVYRLFQNAYEWLEPGGRLYVVIRKNQGAPSAVKELLRIFGNCETVERQSGFHVLRCVKMATVPEESSQ